MTQVLVNFSSIKSNIMLRSHVLLGCTNGSIKSGTPEMIRLLYQSGYARNTVSSCGDSNPEEQGETGTCAEVSKLKSKKIQTHVIQKWCKEPLVFSQVRRRLGDHGSYLQIFKELSRDEEIDLSLDNAKLQNQDQWTEDLERQFGAQYQREISDNQNEWSLNGALPWNAMNLALGGLKSRLDSFPEGSKGWAQGSDESQLNLTLPERVIPFLKLWGICSGSLTATPYVVL